MRYAIKESEKIEATPKTNANCPICNEEVISKCGTINEWHWAHKDLQDCDNWSEPESAWHKVWKNEFPKEQQEFTMGKHRADIRTSDRTIIELQNSSISPEEIIEREKYYKRMIWLLNGETLCNGLQLRNKRKKVVCGPREEGAFHDHEWQCYSKYVGEEYISFRWKHPRKSWWYAEKPIYIDMSHLYSIYNRLLYKYEQKIKSGEYSHEDIIYRDIYKEKKEKSKKNQIFLIKKIYSKIPCGGWGIMLSKQDFLKQFKKEGVKDGDYKTIRY